MGQGFRGNCDSLGKLGMCPSLAEPDTIGFPKSNVSHETLYKNCTCSNETGAMNIFLRENNLHTIRQNRFAVCLRAVRQWLCCPN